MDCVHGCAAQHGRACVCVHDIVCIDYVHGCPWVDASYACARVRSVEDSVLRLVKIILLRFLRDRIFKFV